MITPINASISAVSRELNIPFPPLFARRLQTCNQAPQVTPPAELDHKFDSQSKAQIVLETATFNVVNLATYCRSKGVNLKQIAQCRAQCEAAFNPKPISAAVRATAQQIQLLERELLRKNKALAEDSAVRILRKNRMQSGDCARNHDQYSGSPKYFHPVQ
jgi:transposase